jgi:uncharacterized Zn-finger protein
MFQRKRVKIFGIYLEINNDYIILKIYVKNYNYIYIVMSLKDDMVDERPFKCDLCDSDFKLNGHLKRHKQAIHSINKIFYYCDICGKKFTEKYTVTKHKRNTHNIGLIIYTCEVCGNTFKSKDNLKSHKRNIHSIDLILFECNICNKQFKCNSHLSRHKSTVHNPTNKFFDCLIDGCNKKFKYKNTLQTHLTNEHESNICIFKCNECSASFKNNGHLIRHISTIHTIETYIKWFICDESECNARFKSNSHLKRHKENIHDIGAHQCDFCTNNRNSHILYKDTTGSHHICRKCYNKATGKHTRVESIWSDYLDKHIGTEYLLCSDTNLKAMGGCQLYRPDKLYNGIDLVELDECDEHQHSYGNGSYECDEKRILDIYEEDGIVGKNMVVIRWNPDHYRAPEGYTKKLRQERLELHVKLKQYLRENIPSSKIHVFYMFYDEDNPNICQNIEKTMIYDEEDFLDCTF